MVVLSWLGRFLLQCNIKKSGRTTKKQSSLLFSIVVLPCWNVVINTKEELTDES
ncbi:hypothetical protein ABIV_0940 [Halarcobacter bivalviorum]|uniref:Uncharacterized protein n=1 Tax=Halarcobacter bivalviorum TaxID=663364 RepID=A0AB33GH11_9BACT|nr:hypothetical protein ABIV_0940 [Halarcobacter bivalviorum]